MSFIYFSTHDLVSLAEGLLGTAAPIRDLGLLGSAAARPQTTVFSEDAYPDIWTKAASLLHSVVNNHPLVDGNKRLGWLATAVFLELNGASVAEAPNDAVYDLVIQVAREETELALIATTLARFQNGGGTD